MPAEEAVESLLCLRCRAPLVFAGAKHFHEGTRAWDFLGGVFELLKERIGFDLYVCPQCGHAEFFVLGLGAGDRTPSEREASEAELLQRRPDAPSLAGPPWTCRCGETVPGNFDCCWKCQAPRSAGREPGA